MNQLASFLRQRLRELGLSMTGLAKSAELSRQTIYSLEQSSQHLPDMQTLVRLARVLKVHPLRLIHLVFDDYPMPSVQSRAHAMRGDKSAFVSDVTLADGTIVPPNALISKIWECQNVGSVAWEGRVLCCEDDEIEVYSRSGEKLQIAPALIPEVRKIPVPTTPPGGIVRLEVSFRTPAMPGTCLSYWKTYFADGSLCFPKSVGLSVRVQVMTLQAASH